MVNVTMAASMGVGFSHRRRDLLIGVGGLVATGSTAAMLKVLPGVTSTEVALALLLVVVVTATFGRLWIAIAIAVVATLTFNFLFLPPVGTFTIADPQNWVALVTFLVTAVTASNLSAAAKARAEGAERVRQKAEFASTLLAALSHDLKTPLTAIRVAVENLRDDLPAVDRRSQAMAAIVELERLDRLFQEILDMARIDAEAIHVEQQWVTPADIVDAAAAHVRHTLDGRALEIRAEGDTVVELDPRVASVALSHLLENAARYSPPDRRISVEASADRDGLRVTVSDHGPGLDPGELEHLFDRFYRGRTARQHAPGSGLGLAITRGLLNAVGGRVWAENLPSAGARFTIVVPGRLRRQAMES